uniref:T-cell leukemia translocation-altered gene protein homolog n=1 Tax=Gouania willdenowi TaxID=441366 RepID=A0A8C5NCZ2_GOUWI
MDDLWDFEFLSRIADGCLSFFSEFVTDWLANDMRVSIFKILLSWLIFSLIAIHFAWKSMGYTARTEEPPDTAPHLSSSWKHSETHQE